MPIQNASLNPTGGLPQVEINVGFAHFAKYEFWLYDATGSNPVKFAEGDNSDTILDIFSIGNPPIPINDLANRTLFWRAAIVSPVDIPEQNYAVTIRVSQDSLVVGTDSKTGPIESPPPFGFIRLEVA